MIWVFIGPLVLFAVYLVIENIDRKTEITELNVRTALLQRQMDDFEIERLQEQELSDMAGTIASKYESQIQDEWEAL